MFESELEVLLEVRSRLSNEVTSWEFGCWQACTCGHIYAAAADNNGVYESREQRICRPAPGTLYERTLQAVARANPGRAHRSPNTAAYEIAYLISDATVSVGKELDMIAEGSDDQPTRDAALVLIDATIEMLETEYENARLEVVAKTKHAQQRTGPAVKQPAKVVV